MRIVMQKLVLCERKAGIFLTFSGFQSFSGCLRRLPALRLSSRLALSSHLLLFIYLPDAT